MDDAPTAAANVTPTEPNPDETVTFDASASTDPNENDPLTYEWTFGDGTTATGANLTHSYATGGNYSVSLTVTDSYGKSDTENWTVSVNHAPIANATATPTTVNVSETVTFDASDSSDPDGDALTYEWDFDGDGTVDATGETVTHSYSASGIYGAKLTVTDTNGAKSAATVNVNAQTRTPTEGLIHYWALNETTGSTAYDYPGAADGSVIGATQGVAGPDGSLAYSFPTGSSGVDISSDPLPTDEFTVSFWMKADSWSYGGDAHQLLGDHSWGSGFDWTIQQKQRQDALRARLNNGGRHSVSVHESQLGTNEWHLVTFSYDGETMRLYVDDTAVDANSNPSGDYTSSFGDVRVATMDDGSHDFKGDIAKIRIYNRVLTSTEIADIYEAK